VRGRRRHRTRDGYQDMSNTDSVVISGHEWAVSEYDFRKHAWRRISPADRWPGRSYRYDRVD
jgi:hypothetical protein